MVERQAQLTADDPAIVELALLANLARATTFPPGVELLNTIAIDDSQQGGRGQEGVRPVLVSAQQPTQSGTVGQTREQLPMIARQPAIEGPVADTLDGMQQAQGDYFTGSEMGLAMFLLVWHLIVYLAKELSDKIFSSHASLLRLVLSTHTMRASHDFFNVFLN